MNARSGEAEQKIKIERKVFLESFSLFLYCIHCIYIIFFFSFFFCSVVVAVARMSSLLCSFAFTLPPHSIYHTIAHSASSMPPILKLIFFFFFFFVHRFTSVDSIPAVLHFSFYHLAFSVMDFCYFPSKHSQSTSQSAKVQYLYESSMAVN